MSASPLARLGLPSADDGGTGEPSNRRALLGLAGLALAAVVAASVFLLGGSDDVGDLGIAPAAAAAPGPQGPEPAATAGPAEPTPTLGFPDAGEVRDGRDPFAPLYVDPAATGAGDVPPPSAAPEPAPDTDEQPVAPHPDHDGGPPSTATPEQGASVGDSIALLRVEGEGAARSAVVTIDGTEQRAAVGEGFGPSGALLLLSLQEGPAAGQWTAVVQLGQGDPFDLVTGAVVRLPTAQ